MLYVHVWVIKVFGHACVVVCQFVFRPHHKLLQGMKVQDATTEKPEAYKAFLSHKRNQQIHVSVLSKHKQQAIFDILNIFSMDLDSPSLLFE